MGHEKVGDKTMFNRRCIAGLVLLGLSGGVAANEVALRYGVAPGTSYAFQGHSVLTSKLDMRTAEQSMQVDQVMESILAGTAVVEDVAAGRPSRLRLKIDAQAATQLTTAGSTQRLPFFLAGRDVVVAVNGNRIAGVRTSQGKLLDVDANVLGALRPFVVFDEALLPPHKVDLGDSWQAKIEDPNSGTVNALTLTVSSVDATPSAGRVTLDSRGTFVSEQAGATMSGDMAGAIVVDTGNGLPVSTTGTGTVHIDNTVLQAGQSVSITGVGTLEVTRSLSYGGVSQAAHPEFADYSATPSPTPAPPPSAGDPRLAGMYKGESVFRGDAYANTQLFWVFDGAGGVYYGAQTHWTTSARDYNLDLVWSASGTTGNSGDRGRWRTANGILDIDWEDGETSRFAYGFEPNGALVFRHPQTRKLINFYDRLR